MYRLLNWVCIQFWYPVLFRSTLPTVELQNLGLLVIDKCLGIDIDRSKPSGSGGFGSVYKITTTGDTVKRKGSKKELVEVRKLDFIYLSV